MKTSTILRNSNNTILYNIKNKSEVTVGNEEIALVQKLDAHELVESYEKGELKGELKEIAAKLNEDSNPVIMLIKYKK